MPQYIFLRALSIKFQRSSSSGNRIDMCVDGRNGGRADGLICLYDLSMTTHLRRFNLAGNNVTYLDLQMKWSVILSDYSHASLKAGDTF